MKSEMKKGRKKRKLSRWGGHGQHQVGEGTGRRRGPSGEGMKEEEEWKLGHRGTGVDAKGTDRKAQGPVRPRKRIRGPPHGHPPCWGGC